MRGGDSTGDLIADYASAPLLPPRQVIELFRLYRAGLEPDATPKQQRAGKRAKDRVMRSNLRLVISVARGYRRRVERTPALDFQDLIQEGTIGLSRAVELYSIERGFAFSTYATWWIRQSIIRAITNQSDTIRLPVQIREVLDRARHAPSGLNREELAAHCRAPLPLLERALVAVRQKPASLDEHLRGGEDGEGDARGDTCGATDETCADRWMLDDLRQAVECLKALDPEAVALMELRHLEGTRVADLAPLLGVSSTSAGEVLAQHRRRLEVLAGSDALALLAEAG